MKIIIFFICIILIVILLNYNKLITKESFYNTLDIGENKFITKNNVFFGYSIDEANELKKILKENENIDLSKGNLILKNIGNYNFNKLHLNGIAIDNTRLDHLFHGSGSNIQPRIKYQNYNLITRQVGQPEFDPSQVLYNHEDKYNEVTPPNQLCLKDNNNTDICIKKDHLAMLNGSKTIKLRKSGLEDHYLLPIYTYSGGDNESRRRMHIEEPDPLRRPFEFIFYQTNSLINGPDNRSITNNKLPHALHHQTTTYHNWNNVRYFVLYNAYSKSYMFTNANGLNYRTPKISDDCIYEFDGVWHGIHGRQIFKRFCESNDVLTPPIGLKNVLHNKWLCNERIGWSHHGGCTIFATQNRPWFIVGWEGMYLQKIIDPQMAGGNFPLKVYIRSWGCNLGLSAWTGLPIIHFSGNFDINNPSIYGHNMWDIIPMPYTCSEPCKADYNSDISCGPNNFCTAPQKKDIPKRYQCPEDRPICRYYHGKQMYGEYLGHCSKPGSYNSNNIHSEITKTGYRYAKPPRKVYDTSVPQTNEDNDDSTLPQQKQDFYSEYTIKMAKSKTGQLYEPDVFSHYHKH